MIFSRKQLFLVLFIFGGQLAVSAQLDNQIFKRPYNDIQHREYQAVRSQYLDNDTINQLDSLYNDSTNPNSSFVKTTQSDIYNYRSGFSFGNLLYCKNNEFGESNNPGQTFFGNQIWFGGKYYFTQNLSTSLGYFMQYDFGDNQFPSKGLPIFNIEYNTERNRLIAGSLLGNTNHNLIEPLYNYENTFTKPIEYGIQYFHFNKLISYQTWLDWRQFAKIETSQQEKISFGQTLLIKVIEETQLPFQLSFPASLLIYHQGGEALNVPQKIQTNANGSVGVKLNDINNNFKFESHLIFSNDVSPSINHAFKDGYGTFTYFTVFVPQNKNNKNQHRIVASYFKASEYYSPLGAPLYTSELFGKPYLYSRNREFFMLRYQFVKLFSNFIHVNPIQLDIRIEPIYHIQEKLFAFSTGVYLKILLGDNFIH